MTAPRRLPPCKLAPWFQTRIWGFDDLRPWFEYSTKPGEEPVDRLCAAQADSLTDLPVAVLTRRLGRLSDDAMRRLCAAIDVAAGCTGA